MRWLRRRRRTLVVLAAVLLVALVAAAVVVANRPGRPPEEAGPTTSTTRPDRPSTTTRPGPTTTTQPAPTTTTEPPTPSGLPFPGPGTVGHLADFPGHTTPATDLDVHEGGYESTADGEVIEGLRILGDVIVRHEDVTVRRNRIVGNVRIDDGASADVEWNTIGVEEGEERSVGGGTGQDVRYYRNEVFGTVDLFNFYGDGNVEIEENWAYGAYQRLDDPFQQRGSSTQSHSDGVQIHHGGERYRIVRNRFDLFLFRGFEWDGRPNRSDQVRIASAPTARSQLGVVPNVAPMTAGVLIQASEGPVRDVLIEGNHFDGDYYWAILIDGRVRNVRVVDNTFVQRYPLPGEDEGYFGRNGLLTAEDLGEVVFDDNTDEDGREIPRPEGSRRRGG